MKKNKNLQQSELEWLVISRNRVQLLLFNFDTFLNRKDSKDRAKNDKDFRRIAGFMLGASFALWRACFLIKDEAVHILAQPEHLF